MKQNDKTILQRAQEMAAKGKQPLPGRAMDDHAPELDQDGKTSSDVPVVPVEYVKGKPQIMEVGALLTGLINRLPNGPRTDEKGSSPVRQRRILEQAVSKMKKRKLWHSQNQEYLPE